MKMFVCTALVTAVSLLAPGVAHAQRVSLADEAKPGFISIGAFAGGELDLSDNWLVLGADARLGVAKPSFELNPRFTYRPFPNGSVTQIDLNFLRNYDLARPGRFRPYGGIGVTLQRVSFKAVAPSTVSTSDSALGLNLISGARIAMRSGAAYEPFFGGQYSILVDRGNTFTLVAGASFSLH